jgi:hypothetical protein
VFVDRSGVTVGVGVSLWVCLWIDQVSLASPTLYLGAGEGKGSSSSSINELFLHQNSGAPIRLLACQLTAFLET